MGHGGKHVTFRESSTEKSPSPKCFKEPDDMISVELTNVLENTRNGKYLLNFIADEIFNKTHLISYMDFLDSCLSRKFKIEHIKKKILAFLIAVGFLLLGYLIFMGIIRKYSNIYYNCKNIFTM